MFLAAIFGATLLVSMVAGRDVDCGDDPAPNGLDGRTIAFHAILDRDYTFQPGELVVYKHVTLNEGGGYNNTTGVFTAPKKGVYLFQIQATAKHNNYAYLRLYKNSVNICSVHFASTNFAINAGNSVIVKVDKGDRFVVDSAVVSFLLSDTIGSYTSFNGFLIWSLS